MNQKIYNLIILDASGSMYSIRNEAIAGSDHPYGSGRKCRSGTDAQSGRVQRQTHCHSL